MEWEHLRKFINEELAAKAENHFAREVYKHDMELLEILNWYRNLYHKEGLDTERGLMANAINDLFIKYKDLF